MIEEERVNTREFVFDCKNSRYPYRNTAVFDSHSRSSYKKACRHEVCPFVNK